MAEIWGEVLVAGFMDRPEDTPEPTGDTGHLS
jgi:hypothetical protein